MLTGRLSSLYEDRSRDVWFGTSEGDYCTHGSRDMEPFTGWDWTEGNWLTASRGVLHLSLDGPGCGWLGLILGMRLVRRM